jgi:hypothetical protein
MFDKEKIRRIPYVVDGATHVGVVELDPKDVYIPLNAQGRPVNITREELDENNIQILMEGMGAGIDYSVPLIVIEKILPFEDSKGKNYSWKLVAGFHRMNALLRIKSEKWLFDVFSFNDTESMINLQEIENDHTSRIGHSAGGLSNSLAYRVNQGFLENTEDAMREHLKVLHNVHPTVKANAIKKAISLTGAYQSFSTYDTKQVIQHLSNKNNYAKDVSIYPGRGALDKARDQHCYTVKLGTIYQYVCNAARKWADHGKASYFLFHTNRPTEKEPLSTKRRLMLEELSSWENSLDKACEYKKKHGVYPWRVQAFIAQDRRADTYEKTFIDPKDIKPSQVL